MNYKFLFIFNVLYLLNSESLPEWVCRTVSNTFTWLNAVFCMCRKGRLVWCSYREQLFKSLIVFLFCQSNHGWRTCFFVATQSWQIFAINWLNTMKVLNFTAPQIQQEWGAESSVCLEQTNMSSATSKSYNFNLVVYSLDPCPAGADYRSLLQIRCGLPAGRLINIRAKARWLITRTMIVVRCLLRPKADIYREEWGKSKHEVFTRFMKFSQLCLFHHHLHRNPTQSLRRSAFRC